MPTSKNIARGFLIAVPFLSAVFGFGVGHVSPAIYIPVWILLVFLMLGAVYLLGYPVSKNKDQLRQFYTLLLILVPWMLFSIFGGMGAPPDTAEAFAAASGEQEVRYTILALGGIATVTGFALLRQQLKKDGENFYSEIGYVLLIPGIILFILNMVYWGSFLTEAFKVFVQLASPVRPDWYAPARNFFAMVSRVEVSLLYASTVAFAASLKQAGWLKKTACNVYMVVSLLAIVLNLLPETVPAPLAIPAYLVAIPAIPFIMLYLIGVNLLASGKGQTI